MEINIVEMTMTKEQLKPVSKCLSKIKRRTFGLQLVVATMAVLSLVVSFYLIITAQPMETRVGVGGVLATILSACLVASLRLHTCLNSVDVTQVHLELGFPDKAENTLNNSSCLKRSGIQELIQR